jgi:hypothetical protein
MTNLVNVSETVSAVRESEINKYLELGWKILAIEKDSRIGEYGESATTTFVLGWDKVQAIPAVHPEKRPSE